MITAVGFEKYMLWTAKKKTGILPVFDILDHKILPAEFAGVISSGSFHHFFGVSSTVNFLNPAFCRFIRKVFVGKKIVHQTFHLGLRQLCNIAEMPESMVAYHYSNNLVIGLTFINHLETADWDGLHQHTAGMDIV